jgi:hypothetical protein
MADAENRAYGRPGGAWRRLWEAADPASEDCPDGAIDASALGEYAVLLRRHGAPAAARAFPSVAVHLATGCSACLRVLDEALRFLAREQRRRRVKPGQSRG